MNDAKYQYTLYLIVVVIIATIGIQTYWNYKNYLSNKQQLITDVQISLDKAVDDYYAEIAQNTTLGLKYHSDNEDDIFKEDGVLDRLTKSIDDNNSQIRGLDSIDANSIKGVTVLRGFAADSFMKSKNKENNPESSRFSDLFKNTPKDSSRLTGFGKLTSKILISITNDTLNLKTIDSMVGTELLRKNIKLNFDLDFMEAPSRHFKNNKSVIVKSEKQTKKTIDSTMISTVSKSTFLPNKSTLRIYFENESLVILKRIFGGMLISFILVLAVIASLFYLLHIIKQQKQLAEIKNDLISNITHEFKTPIATIGVALEGIKNFNGINDKTKTKRYLDMSTDQLSKLNIMVEKLLETATLDSEFLELHKERVNLSEVIKIILEKTVNQNRDKNLTFNIKENCFAIVDSFHFENAVNNLLDNAFKYGGNNIVLNLMNKKTHLELSVLDDGNTLSKSNKDQIFEKFYRVPKGHTHDVKGFGIGLYYTKTIIEKHGGTINLELKPNHTNFTISLPND